MKTYNHISVAIPMLAELSEAPRLIDCLRKQTFKDIDIYVCVNQPDDWWENDKMQPLCNENAMLLQWLKEQTDIPIHIIDKSSRGKGWDNKKKGVGWARKVLFDKIIEDKADTELIVSLDADTEFSDNYLQSVLTKMNTNSQAMALAVPYYHKLTSNNRQNQTLLRYETYMRYYMLQMLQIHNPYAFTALGSAMVFPLKAYKKVGGITPMQAGEDFYLMQKFAKTGTIAIHNTECVYPSGRISLRVPFGTGPAVNKDIENQDSSYPFYPSNIFKLIEETFSCFPKLYTQNLPTPMTSFLENQLKTTDLWQPMRKNYKKIELFVKACVERVDGLRILQFLKQEYSKYNQTSSEGNLIEYCTNNKIDIDPKFSFLTSDIETLDSLRNKLFEKENALRLQHDDNILCK